MLSHLSARIEAADTRLWELFIAEKWAYMITIIASLVHYNHVPYLEIPAVILLKACCFYFLYRRVSGAFKTTTETDEENKGDKKSDEVKEMSFSVEKLEDKIQEKESEKEISKLKKDMEERALKLSKDFEKKLAEEQSKRQAYELECKAKLDEKQEEWEDELGMLQIELQEKEWDLSELQEQLEKLKEEKEELMNVLERERHLHKQQKKKLEEEIYKQVATQISQLINNAEGQGEQSTNF